MSQIETEPISGEVITPIEATAVAIRETLLAKVEEQSIDGPWAVAAGDSSGVFIFKGRWNQIEVYCRPDLSEKTKYDPAFLEDVGTTKERAYYSISPWAEISYPGQTKSLGILPQAGSLLIEEVDGQVKVREWPDFLSLSAQPDSLDFLTRAQKALKSESVQLFQLSEKVLQGQAIRDCLDFLFPNRPQRA